MVAYYEPDTMLFSLIQHIAANVLAGGSEAPSYNLIYDRLPPITVYCPLNASLECAFVQNTVP